MRRRSKLLAEKRAYELCGEQSQWSLVTIQPPVVQGPPPGGRHFPYSKSCRALPSSACCHQYVFTPSPAVAMVLTVAMGGRQAM